MTEIKQIPVSEVVPGENDRQHFDQVALEELADSIGEHGLAQPITVRPTWICSCCGRRDSDFPEWCDDCHNDTFRAVYEIVAGERRVRAVRILGWETIPAIVRTDLSDEAASAIMLAENIQRVELNPIEEARAYRKRMDRFGWDADRVAEAANVSVARVRLRLALLDLVPEAQKLVEHDNMGIKFGYAMRDLDSNRQRIALRWLRDQENPHIKHFRRLCGELLAEQAQEAMFDLVQFMSEVQEEIEEEADRGVRQIPVDGSLPAMVKARSVGAALERYIYLLLQEGRRDAAGVVGSVYQGLLQYSLTSMPENSPLDESGVSDFH